MPAIVLKSIKSAKILFWVQDIWPESLSATGAVKFPLFLKLTKQLTRFIYHQCDLILVQSRAFIPSVQSFGVGVSRIIYFPNSAEEFYQPVKLDDDAEEYRAMPRGFIVMFAGNIGAAQDFKTIISAAEILKDYHDIYWVIIGEGRMRSWVEEAVKTRNLDRTFLLFKRQSPERMPAYFSLANALLVTLCKSEIFKLTIPSKLQPYLACARPVIAALEGEGARIIEESRSGFSCRSEDPDALAKLVLKMYHTGEKERQAMGSNAKQYFEKNFEQKMLLNQLDRIMNDLKRREAECVS
ncbi:MAG: glycosyltransferase family 4 protein [Candidatus Omnitrophica bacterium]|nr:glycosyltransferase family 4 protein [Candidatus Omnitrophota bacterium]